VIDGAKGVESQTQKLFEVCRLRDLPILTFCNKMDRESRDTFEIIDEIQENLAIDVPPASWPIGIGRDFMGAYDMIHDRLELMDRADRNKRAESIQINGLDDPALEEYIPSDLLEKLREEVEMARGLLPEFDAQAFLDGTMSGMKLTHVRTNKPMAISNPVLFLASDRELAEEAWAGDIMGIPNHGQLRIGDALTEGEKLAFAGIPSEYGLPVRFEQTQFTSARWINGPQDKVDAFVDANKGHMAMDHDGDHVYMTRLQWDIDRVERDYPDIKLTATKETYSH